MKSIFVSKTFWFNLITGIVGGTAFITGDSLTQLGISEVWQHRILFLVGAIGFIGNIYLRSVTSEPVTIKSTPKDDVQPN